MRKEKLVNLSLFENEEDFLNKISRCLFRRNKIDKDFVFPSSLNDIPKDIVYQMEKIDEIYQKGLLSLSNTINVMTELIERLGVIDSVLKRVDPSFGHDLKGLYDIVERKNKDLLYSLKNGFMSEEEYIEKYNELMFFKNEEIGRIKETNDKLNRRHR